MPNIPSGIFEIKNLSLLLKFVSKLIKFLYKKINLFNHVLQNLFIFFFYSVCFVFYFLSFLLMISTRQTYITQSIGTLQYFNTCQICHK